LCFSSEDELDQLICLDFKTLRIEPTHYTIRTSHIEESPLKSWTFEGSDDEISWTEIDRRENTHDLNSWRTAKTFVVSRSGSFGRIRLRQIGLNHSGSNCLALEAFELFGEVAGLPDDAMKLRFPAAPRFPFTWAPFNGVISHLTAKCDGNVHEKGIVEITASSVFGTNYPRNAVDFRDNGLCFSSEDEPDQLICLDFKTLRIEPTHYTIQTGSENYLKSWAVEGSDDGASWTEIDRRENTNDLNSWRTAKTFVVSRSGSFERIRLRQTGRNHSGSNCLALEAFELFGRLLGCPMTL
jgi:hypothetical protein